MVMATLMISTDGTSQQCTAEHLRSARNPCCRDYWSEGNNGIGISGVTWDVNLMSLDIFGTKNSASSADMEAIYAVDSGADVINMSLGATYNLSMSEYIDTNSGTHNGYLNALHYAVNNGTTVVIAAGNEQTNFDQGWISTPAYFSELIDGVISVAAIANSGQRSSYSNYGSEVTIGAPGVTSTSLEISKMEYLQPSHIGITLWIRTRHEHGSPSGFWNRRIDA